MMVKGTLVAVRFDPNSQIPNLAAKEYNNTIHRISKVSNYGTKGKTFELDGAVSGKGLHYTFTPDELEVVR